MLNMEPINTGFYYYTPKTKRAAWNEWCGPSPALQKVTDLLDWWKKYITNNMRALQSFTSAFNLRAIVFSFFKWRKLHNSAYNAYTR